MLATILVMMGRCMFMKQDLAIHIGHPLAFAEMQTECGSGCRRYVKKKPYNCPPPFQHSACIESETIADVRKIKSCFCFMLYKIFRFDYRVLCLWFIYRINQFNPVW